MSKNAQKELLDWLDGEIKSCEKRLDSSINMGWDGKASVSMSLLRKFRPLRHLVKNFGQWQKEAEALWELSPIIEGLVDGVPLKELIRNIRDFDLMKEER